MTILRMLDLVYEYDYNSLCLLCNVFDPCHVLSYAGSLFHSKQSPCMCTSLTSTCFLHILYVYTVPYLYGYSIARACVYSDVCIMVSVDPMI